MVPLIVLLVAAIVFRLLAVVGLLHAAASWSDALRFAFALMFVVTGVMHFVPRGRVEMTAMVPPGLPRPDLLVTLTGIFELLGAVGLLVPGLVRPSAYSLIALLVAMFPANVRAARMHLMVAGRPAMALSLRLPLQLFWIGALAWIAHTA
jgi:uncharacterized membrane protein